ncbi:hypothetical protein Smp_158120 [Schistosoma mansoni]|uniref:hypothetical protein n=1 Tax=Schistosoma mansoni TaxID=6183 RepID=UPI00022C8758|nr:hypothetical protein Smp_158120 [Schistosoma mansoni]|eukprot:XP_018645132.1 hypothetical protein Smp_158120 [Schistosoma mansoni]
MSSRRWWMLPRANDSLNPLCIDCQRINGVCVVNNRKNGLLLNDYYQDNLQCACPRKPNISDIQKYSFFDLCNPIPVDIGEECNHINKVCISQKAICHKNSMNDLDQTQLTTKHNLNICVCHDGWIPVYQKNLDYFECYEVQQSINRDVNSKQIYHNGYHMENICQLHNTNIIIDNNRLNKERKDTECDIIEQNQPDHPHPHQHHQYQQQQLHPMNSLPKSKQANQYMECLFTYPLNKSNTILHYTNSYLKSPIYDQQDHNNVDQNDNDDHDLPHFTMDSCIKTKNNNLPQHISKSTLNIVSSNQMKVPIEHSIINSCIHKDVLLPTCYHNDCLKQQYDYCTIYHNLKNHNYNNGWV